MKDKSLFFREKKWKAEIFQKGGGEAIEARRNQFRLLNICKPLLVNTFRRSAVGHLSGKDP
jgi:hypothetical protein